MRHISNHCQWSFWSDLLTRQLSLWAISYFVFCHRPLMNEVDTSTFYFTQHPVRRPQYWLVNLLSIPWGVPSIGNLLNSASRGHQPPASVSTCPIVAASSVNPSSRAGRRRFLPRRGRETASSAITAGLCQGLCWGMDIVPLSGSRLGKPAHVCIAARAFQRARVPVILISSPINFADCLIGAPITI